MGEICTDLRATFRAAPFQNHKAEKKVVYGAKRNRVSVPLSYNHYHILQTQSWVVLAKIIMENTDQRTSPTPVRNKMQTEQTHTHKIEPTIKCAIREK